MGVEAGQFFGGFVGLRDEKGCVARAVTDKMARIGRDLDTRSTAKFKRGYPKYPRDSSAKYTRLIKDVAQSAVTCATNWREGEG